MGHNARHLFLTQTPGIFLEKKYWQADFKIISEQECLWKNSEFFNGISTVRRPKILKNIYRQDGDTRFLRNVGTNLRKHTTSQPRRQKDLCDIINKILECDLLKSTSV